MSNLIKIYTVFGHATWFIMGAPIQNPIFVEKVWNNTLERAHNGIVIFLTVNFCMLATCLSKTENIFFGWNPWKLFFVFNPVKPLYSKLFFSFYFKNYHLLRGMIVINGGNLVQTFFFISGFLNSMSLLSYVERTHKKNFLVFIKAVIYRIIRFVPVLLFLILLHSTWLQRLDDGPYWDKFNAYERQACRKNMWWNLLLINNYLSDEMRCMIHTWYIAADFQLSVIGTAIILMVVKWV